jgi:hypothetical protein
VRFDVPHPAEIRLSMAIAKVSPLTSLASGLFRPAIVEAKLMTAKHARDAVYVATLAEELTVIDSKLSALEEALHVDSLQNADRASFGPCRMPESGPDANWIREKSGEQDLRLRHIEQKVPVSSAQHTGPATRNRKRAPARDAL